MEELEDRIKQVVAEQLCVKLYEVIPSADLEAD